MESSNSEIIPAARQVLETQQESNRGIIKNILRKLRIKDAKKDAETGMIFSVPMIIDRNFNLEEFLNSIKGPFVEVGGPTSDGYWFGNKNVNLEELKKDPNKKVVISNIYPGLPVWGRNHKLRFEGTVDMQADATLLPLRDSSVGALFTSNLGNDVLNEFIPEAARVLAGNGLLFVQGLPENQVQAINQKGFAIREAWKEISSFGSRELYSTVFQKVPTHSTKPTS